MQSVLILGRQPALGLAEIESLYGADKIRPVGDKAAIVDVDPCLLAFDRLGGSVKFCKILTTLNTTNWDEIEKFLIQTAPGHSERLPPGKLRLGLSLLDIDIGLAKLESSGLKLKKIIRKTGRSVRLVPNKSTQLNAAQVLHNQLTGPIGWELVFIRDSGKKAEQTIIAQTVKVQDIEAYSGRDRRRPKRDSKVGMLPPKLAQIIVNLAVGRLQEDKLVSICQTPLGEPTPRPRLEGTILDPFCGTGVVLQEACLMGYEGYGSDQDPRMVDYSESNLAWLAKSHRLPAVCCRVETADATNHIWKKPFDYVASESYLGRPFTSDPSPEVLAQTVSDCNLIISKFLRNLHRQLKPGTRLCLAIPAWQVKPNNFKQLPLIDQIGDLGYNRVSFEHAGDEALIYYRQDQIVARQLIVIARK